MCRWPLRSQHLPTCSIDMTTLYCMCVLVLLPLLCADCSPAEQKERSKKFVQGLPEVNKEVVQYVIGLMVKVSGREGVGVG